MGGLLSLQMSDEPDFRFTACLTSNFSFQITRFSLKWKHTTKTATNCLKITVMKYSVLLRGGHWKPEYSQLANTTWKPQVVVMVRNLWQAHRDFLNWPLIIRAQPSLLLWDMAVSLKFHHICNILYSKEVVMHQAEGSEWLMFKRQQLSLNMVTMLQIIRYS